MRELPVKPYDVWHAVPNCYIPPAEVVIIMAFAVAWVAAVFVVTQSIVSYELTSKSVRVLVFGRISLATIPLRSISEIRTCSRDEAFLKLPWSARKLGSRPWARSGVLILRNDRALRRQVLLTPRDPEDFVSNVRMALLALRRYDEHRSDRT